jgi:hypothetical protein
MLLLGVRVKVRGQLLGIVFFLLSHGFQVWISGYQVNSLAHNAANRLPLICISSTVFGVVFSAGPLAVTGIAETKLHLPHFYLSRA